MATYLDGPFGTPAQQGAKQISFPLQNQKDYSAKEIVREMMQYPSTGYYPIIQNQVSATNSLKWSDDLTQVGNWSDGSLVAILANATTDPQGGISASAIQEISGSGVHYMAQSGATLAGVGPTGFGVFLKANGRTFARLLGSTTADGTLCTTMFNLALGTVVSTTSGQASIKSVGNGWFWCTVSGTSTSVAGTS